MSPSFLQRLGITSKKLPRPIPATSFIGPPISVTHYIELELSSPYRKEYRFRQVFYVIDLSFHKIDLPSAQVVKMAEERNVSLSHQFDTDRSHNVLDMFIGRAHVKLTGFEMVADNRIDLNSPAHGIRAQAFYTHFGYLLSGDEKTPRSAGMATRSKRKDR